ncbi:MAG: prolipoprotein diacylglyceryl transferase family protein [Verrucomicrobiia bacterium]|mgnify:FL=1|jgi:phosphatidylglycerol:prolipoprotein diacylglycerol transferase|nr:prolipoprotein diacylglyceryl transferase [Verrucomicrobiota bacterium]|tara:strand:- start:408 stop:1157 length:750 start_codon:yes stop_codon:yes gene_type:complete
MWPVIPIPLGTHPEQIYTYSLLIALGVCHLFIGVDAAACRQKLGRAESSKYLYCLGLASGGGWVLAMVVTRWLYGGHVPWGTAAAMPGLIGGAAILFVSAKAFHVPLREYLELTIPYLCYMHAWGRLGCFMAGCCHGAPTDSFLGVQFPADSPACQLYGVQPVHPTQLYEMGLLIVLGLATQFKVPPLHRIWVYLIAYGTGRFFVEYLRGDNRGAISLIPPLSPSQHLAILFVIAGGCLAVRHLRLAKR